MVWVWESLDALTIIVVALGCWGEVWVEHHKFKSKPLDLMPVEFVKSKYRILFGRMVWIALAIEFFAFGMALIGSHKEIARLHKQAEDAGKDAAKASESAVTNELRVEELKATNRELSKLVFKLTPRQLTYDQMDWLQIFLNSRDKSKDEPVRLRADSKDSESYRFALDIQAALAMGGIMIREIEPYNASAQTPLDISFSTWGESTPPLIAKYLIAGFSSIGYEPKVVKNRRSIGIIISVGGNRQFHESKFVWLIFDGNGTILAEAQAGAAQFIEGRKISVSPLMGTNTHIAINVVTNRNLQMPPFLFFLGATNRALVVGESGVGSAWEFNLPFQPPNPTNRTTWKCRLELWPP